MTPLFNTWRVSDWKKTIRRRYLSKRWGLWGGQLAWLRSEEMRESQTCLFKPDTNRKVTFWAFSWLELPPATKYNSALLGTRGAADADQTRTNIA